MAEFLLSDITEQPGIVIASHMRHNELCYLDEWVDFHRQQGVKHFYILVWYVGEKEQNDETFINLFNEYNNKYKDTDVTLTRCPFIPPGGICDFCNNHASKHMNDWVAYIDIDEFLYSPMKDKKITDILLLYEKDNVWAVSVNWRTFGSSGWIQRPPDTIYSYTKCYEMSVTKALVKISKINMNAINVQDKRWPKYKAHWLPMIESVRYHTTIGKLVKEHNDEICRKKGIKAINPHFPSNEDYHVAPDGDDVWLRINHYIIKSKEDFKKKTENIIPGLGYERRYSDIEFDMNNSRCNMTDTSIQEKYRR